MESEWRTFKLSERCSVKSSKRIFASEYVARGVPFMRSKDVIDKSLGSFKSYDLFISDKRYQEIRNAHGSPQQGDLLINSVGNRSGQPYVVRSEGDFYFKDGNILWLHNFREIDANFLSYWFKSDLGQWTLESVMIGSAQKALTIDAIRNLELSFPSLEVQQAIAHILGSLDDKIELNRQMNETLEGMAQALFKSWFVDFDPVIDNAIVAGNPIPEELADRAEVRRAALANGTANREAAKPFPAALKNAEELGWIPVGWEVGPVLHQAKLLSGGTPKTSEDSYWDGEIKWASAKDVSQCGKAFLTETERTITQEGLDNSSTKVIPRFSTVIVSRGATTGRMAMFGDDIAMNQTCYALRFNTGHHFYGYCHARHFIDSLVQTAHGSVFDTITTKTFESSNVVVASSATSGLFENAVQSLFERILTNEHATQSLTKLRDTLLPKLISGELRIPDAEKLAEAALA